MKNEIFTAEEWKEIQDMQENARRKREAREKIEAEARRQEAKKEKRDTLILFAVCGVCMVLVLTALYYINANAYNSCINAGNSAEFCEIVKK